MGNLGAIFMYGVKNAHVVQRKRLWTETIKEACTFLLRSMGPAWHDASPANFCSSSVSFIVGAHHTWSRIIFHLNKSTTPDTAVQERKLWSQAENIVLIMYKAYIFCASIQRETPTLPAHSPWVSSNTTSILAVSYLDLWTIPFSQPAYTLLFLGLNFSLPGEHCVYIAFLA